MKIILLVYFFSTIGSANEILSKLQRVTAVEVANSLNRETTVQDLLTHSNLTASIKATARTEIGALKLKDKLVFTANEEQVEVAIDGKIKLTIKLVNPMLDSFLVNGYATSLLGKTDLERYVYLKKVLRLSSDKSNSAAYGKISILIPQAQAAEKSTWLKDEEISELALATTEITAAAKNENCSKLKENADFKSSRADALKNRMNGVVESFVYGEHAAHVGVNFWCGNLKTQLDKPVVSFYIRCEAGKVESMSYNSRDTAGATIGYINKTEKTFSDTQAITIIQTRFGKDFSASVAKCCGSSSCASQINSIAPLSVTDPQNTHNTIKSKLVK